MALTIEDCGGRKWVTLLINNNLLDGRCYFEGRTENNNRSYQLAEVDGYFYRDVRVIEEKI